VTGGLGGISSPFERAPWVAFTGYHELNSPTLAFGSEKKPQVVYPAWARNGVLLLIDKWLLFIYTSGERISTGSWGRGYRSDQYSETISSPCTPLLSPRRAMSAHSSERAEGLRRILGFDPVR